MGRALFSQAYATPAVRTEPEPSADPYEKWSRWNAFDPDSDEFFKHAQNEVFTDTDEYLRDQERLSLLGGGTGSPGSSESSASDGGSPMAMGPDDPVVLMADAYAAASVEWEHRFLLAGAAEVEWRHNANREEPQRHEMIGYPRVTTRFNPRAPRNVSADSGEQVVRPGRVTRPRSATVTVSTIHPPSSLRNSTTATDIDDGFTGIASHRLSPPLRRTINITPINIPIEPSTPSPVSSESPSTPPGTLYSRQIQHVFTPSPPPTVTPRIYTWNHDVPASPTSPTTGRNIGGPLTNPGARMSLARININPVRVRAGAVV